MCYLSIWLAVESTNEQFLLVAKCHLCPHHFTLVILEVNLYRCKAGFDANHHTPATYASVFAKAGVVVWHEL